MKEAKFENQEAILQNDKMEIGAQEIHPI